MLASLDAFRADLEALAIRKGGPLEIGLLAALAGRVELGGAHSVRVAASHDAPFFT